MKLIKQHQQRLNQLCVEYHIKQLFLFGSVLIKNFTDKSDIDMLVQFSSIPLKDYFDNYMDFKEKVALLFNRPVDLIEGQAIKNLIFRKVIDREKQLIYGVA